MLLKTTVALTIGAFLIILFTRTSAFGPETMPVQF